MVTGHLKCIWMPQGQKPWLVSRRGRRHQDGSFPHLVSGREKAYRDESFQDTSYPNMRDYLIIGEDSINSNGREFSILKETIMHLKRITKLQMMCCFMLLKRH